MNGEREGVRDHEHSYCMNRMECILKPDVPGHAIVMYTESDRCAHLMGASLEAMMYLCMYDV